MSTTASWDHPRTSLYTDHYELTMLQAALHSGAAHRKSVFEAFARRLPDGRRYGIVAGTGRLLEGIADFRFRGPELDFLRRTGVVNQETLDYLADYRFSGDIWGYPEGEAYFPGSPLIVRIDGVSVPPGNSCTSGEVRPTGGCEARITNDTAGPLPLYCSLPKFIWAGAVMESGR